MVGHTEPCARGKCYRCGEKVTASKAKVDDSRAIEYSRLRSSGVSVEEATRVVFGEALPLSESEIEPQAGSQEVG